MAGGFESLGLAPELIRAIRDDLGYLLPTNVQDEAIPLILGGGDIMVAAETGSGKTAAFSLPLLQIIHENLRRIDGSNNKQIHGDPGGNELSTATRIATGWRINALDKDDAIAVSPDGLACQSRTAQWSGARGSNGVCGGCYIFEARVDDEGLCRFGWATQGAEYNLGTDVFGYGFGGTGMKSNAGRFEKYGEPFSKRDIIGCRLDLIQGAVSFTKNGRELGVAYRLKPGTTGPFFPAVVLKNAQASFNFEASWTDQGAALHGSTPFALASPEHTVPFEPKCEATARSDWKLKVRTPRAIILEPTRELAKQVSDCLTVFKKYFTAPTIEHLLLVGGSDTKKAFKKLNGFLCDVVVGTPGRVLDFVEKGMLKTSAVRLFVLDEADHLLSTDCLDGIMKIHKRLPKQGVGELRLQVCFFSATLHSPDISRLAELICHRPTWVDLKGKDAVPETVHHAVVRVNPEQDERTLMSGATVHAKTDGAAVGVGSEGPEEARAEKLKRLKPQVLLGLMRALNMDQALIFCRTNLDCDLLENFLVEVGGGHKFNRRKDSGKENPFSCCVLAGMRSMEDRRANLQAFKEGCVRFLICTDIAARGVDIKGLPFVVNMTLPDEAENYIHRIGRVGRQDCMGLAVSIVAADGCKEKVWYHKNCLNRGRGCTNRKPLDRGGCTIWYNEPSLLKAVEARIKTSIPQLGPGYSLPPELSAEGEGSATVVYGERTGKGGEAGFVDRAQVEAHVQSLKPAVRELADLEFEAQNIWLGLMQGSF